jgi:hypothetical protein
MVPRQLWIGLLAVGGIVAVIGGADAQYTPYYRPQSGGYAPPPPISPYLNLLRGNNTAVNYYLGVKSEIRDRSMQQQILGLERATAPVEVPAEEPFTKLPSTGHPAVFMNYGGYYGGGPGSQLTPQPPGYRPKR